MVSMTGLYIGRFSVVLLFDFGTWAFQCSLHIAYLLASLHIRQCCVSTETLRKRERRRKRKMMRKKLKSNLSRILQALCPSINNDELVNAYDALKK